MFSFGNLNFSRNNEDSVILPTKCRLKSFTVQGTNIQPHVIELNVYESIYKPYITIHAELLDNSPGGISKNLGLKSGDPITFSFDAIEGRSYDGQVYLLGVKGETKNDSLRAVHYIVKGIGSSWMKDQQTLVKQAYQHIPATQVISAIHNSYVGGDGGLRILEGSIGPVDKEVHRVLGMRPFKAIDDLKDRCIYGSCKSGSTMYYRDRDGYVLAPLEVMFRQMGNQQTFVQDNTLGRFITDFEKAKNSIVAIHSLVDEEEVGRIGATKAASAAGQGLGHFNLRSKKNTILPPKMMLSGMVGQIISSVTQHGGKPNFFAFDPSKLDKAQQPFQKARDEWAYKAAFKNGVQFAVKVPINTGINVTVGKGVYLKLVPPQGDLTTDVGADQSGTYLVTTLVHTMKFDDRMFNGFTAFECAKGGGVA